MLPDQAHQMSLTFGLSYTLFHGGISSSRLRYSAEASLLLLSLGNGCGAQVFYRGVPDMGRSLQE